MPISNLCLTFQLRGAVAGKSFSDGIKAEGKKQREKEERKWKKKSKSIETSRMFLKGKRSARANVRPVFSLSLSLHIKLVRSVGKARKIRRKKEGTNSRSPFLLLNSTFVFDQRRKCGGRCDIE